MTGIVGNLAERFVDAVNDWGDRMVSRSGWIDRINAPKIDSAATVIDVETLHHFSEKPEGRRLIGALYVDLARQQRFDNDLYLDEKAYALAQALFIDDVYPHNRNTQAINFYNPGPSNPA